MKHDFFAEYAERWQGHSELDQFAQVQLLAGGLLSQKTEAQRLLKNWILQKKLDRYFESQRQDVLKLGLETEVALENLPPCSFIIQLKMKLRKPYLSKDEQDFYIIDNPVRKDKVFRLPYVAPSSWKGSLRAAMRLECSLKDEDNQMIQLFGNPKGAEEDFQRGRLHFFPTFFDEISLEVINPHDRQTGAGKKPIYIESVPIEAESTFTLLYVPFDRIDKKDEDTCKEVAKDLKLVAQGVKALFTQYGFGAKTSSGFGVAEDQVKQGEIVMAADVRLGEEEPEEIPVEPQMPEVIRKFLEKYPDEDFTLKLNEWRDQHQASKKERGRYREAKDAYRDYKRQLEEYQLKREQQREREEGAQEHSQVSFGSLTELTALAERLAKALREGTDR